MTFEFKNIGWADRGIRIGLALTMLIFGWTGLEGRWVYLWRVLAIYPLLSALAGWCPLYVLLGRRTHSNKL